MLFRTSLLGLTFAGLMAAPAMATVLTTSQSAFLAGTAGLPVQNTTGFPGFDPTAFAIQTTGAIPLTGGGSIGLSNAAQVTQGPSGFGVFPYDFADGFTGVIFIPNDANGNDVSSEVISTGGLSALGFEVAPFGDAAGSPYAGYSGGPYTVTVTTNTGLSASVALPGGMSDGLTQSQFFGFYGGGVSSLAVTVTSATAGTSDPNGLGFGNFVDVPGPGSSALLLGAAWTVLSRVRRRRVAT